MKQNKQRNEEIFLMRLGGDTYTDIAKMHDLSVQTCRSVFFKKHREFERNIKDFKVVELQMLAKITTLSIENKRLKLQDKNHDAIKKGLSIVLNYGYFSNRTAKVLQNNNIKTLGDILTKKRSDLEKMKGFGDECMREVLEFLDQGGMTIGK